MKKALGILIALLIFSTAGVQAATFLFTIFSKVREANPRVVAIAIEFDRALPINWNLDNVFQVTAELLPVKTYAGDLIANSAVAKAPRLDVPTGKKSKDKMIPIR